MSPLLNAALRELGYAAIGSTIGFIATFMAMTVCGKWVEIVDAYNRPVRGGE